MLKVKLLREGAKAPQRMTAGAAGYDLCALLPESVDIQPGGRFLIPCGFSIELPEGFEAQVRSRSGLGVKKGVVCPLGPGTIDWDYRGEVHVLLLNTGTEPFKVNSGDRIGQMVINKVEILDVQVVDELSDSNRGAGGFGSTGV